MPDKDPLRKSAHVYRPDLSFQGFNPVFGIAFILNHASVLIDLASCLGGFQSLFEQTWIPLPLAQGPERSAQAGLDPGPVERDALAGPFLEGGAEGLDCLLQA